MRVLVTGANGFVGKALCRLLDNSGYEVVTATRTETKTGYPNYVVGSLDERTDWTQALAAVDCVVHLAARVHVMKETAIDSLREFMIVNHDATKKLAETAEIMGVKRFIFLSSVAVNGEETVDKPFTEKMPSSPITPYGISKLKAEETLQNVCKKMQLVIIRPPMIYGPEAKGNFKFLEKLCRLPIPLPFSLANKHKRHFVYLGNLCHFIELALRTEGKSGTYFVCDDQPLSLAELITNIRSAMGKKSGLFPFLFLDRVLSLLGLNKIAKKLYGDLRIDNSKAVLNFGWQPPYTPEEGIKKSLEAA